MEEGVSEAWTIMITVKTNNCSNVRIDQLTENKTHYTEEIKTNVEVHGYKIEHLKNGIEKSLQNIKNNNKETFEWIIGVIRMENSIFCINLQKKAKKRSRNFSTLYRLGKILEIL